jgi:hypothetical protein
MLHDGGLPVSGVLGVLAPGASGGDHGRNGAAAEDHCEGGAEMSTKQIIIGQIQSQMVHAVDCLNEDQPGAAQLAYMECASLCQQLELERAMKRQPDPQKQLVIDIK